MKHAPLYKELVDEISRSVMKFPRLLCLLSQMDMDPPYFFSWCFFRGRCVITHHREQRHGQRARPQPNFSIRPRPLRRLQGRAVPIVLPISRRPLVPHLSSWPLERVPPAPVLGNALHVPAAEAVVRSWISPLRAMVLVLCRAFFKGSQEGPLIPRGGPSAFGGTRPAVHFRQTGAVDDGRALSPDPQNSARSDSNPGGLFFSP